MSISPLDKKPMEDNKITKCPGNPANKWRYFQKNKYLSNGVDWRPIKGSQKAIGFILGEPIHHVEVEIIPSDSYSMFTVYVWWRGYARLDQNNQLD